jgi:hypothetical protein
MKKFISIIFLIALLVGCASAPRPTAQQIEAADCGPFPTNYEEIIKSVASKNLIDPYSAQYTFSQPVKQLNRMTGNPVWGWAVCGTVNAKNRFGGYVGAKPYYALIYKGTIVRFLFGGTTIPDSFSLGILSGAMTQSGTSEDMCRN